MCNLPPVYVRFERQSGKAYLITSSGVIQMGLPRRNALASLAYQLRCNATPAERKLWYRFLCSYSVPFRQQKVIGPYIVDFFCNKVRMSIELDGSQHYEEKGRIKDTYRTRYLELLEIKELRFSNYEISNDFEAVCETINIEVTKRKNDLIDIHRAKLKSKHKVCIT